MNRKILSAIAGILFSTYSVLAEDVRIQPKTFTTLVEATAKDIPLRDLKLREAGLTPVVHFKDADEIRILNPADTTRKAPEARIWINTSQTNAYWFHTGGEGSAENYIIKPGRMIVIHARSLAKPVSAPKP